MSRIKKETGWIVAMAIAYFAINFVTAERSPSVWIDEVMYADPGINLALGKGFTSTAWWVDRHRLYAKNPPLHQLVLSRWVKAFGVSPRSVRSLNYILAFFAALLVVFGAKRLRLCPGPGFRLVLLALLLCGAGITFVFRSARPDAIAYFLLAAAFFAASLKRPAVRFTALSLIGVLLPFSSLAHSVSIGFCTLMVLFFYRLPYWNEAIALISGGALGSAMLYSFYVITGTTDIIFGSIRDFAVVRGPWLKVTEFPVILLRDQSLLCLTLLAIVLAVYEGRKTGRVPKALIGVLLLALPLPMLTHLVGHFPIFYTWVAYLPVTIALMAYLAAKWNTLPKSARFVSTAAVAAAILVGFPLRMGLTALEWKERDYRTVVDLVERNVKPGDWLLGDYIVYYPAKKIAEEVFFQSYLTAFSQEDAARVNVMICDPKWAPHYAQYTGGKWKMVDPGVEVKRTVKIPYAPGSFYRLAVYRREN